MNAHSVSTWEKQASSWETWNSEERRGWATKWNNLRSHKCQFFSHAHTGVLRRRKRQMTLTSVHRLVPCVARAVNDSSHKQTRDWPARMRKRGLSGHRDRRRRPLRRPRSRVARPGHLRPAPSTTKSAAPLCPVPTRTLASGRCCRQGWHRPHHLSACS